MLRVRITNLNEVDQVRVALNGDELDQTPGGADGFRKINEMCERRPTLAATGLLLAQPACRAWRARHCIDPWRRVFCRQDDHHDHDHH